MSGAPGRLQNSPRREAARIFREIRAAGRGKGFERPFRHSRSNSSMSCSGLALFGPVRRMLTRYPQAAQTISAMLRRSTLANSPGRNKTRAEPAPKDNRAQQQPWPGHDQEQDGKPENPDNQGGPGADDQERF